MRKFTIILMLALMVSVAVARQPFHNVQVLDEDGRKVTTITSVEIYAPDTTTNAVIYKDRALQNVITIPMTSGSANTTLSNGNFFWYGPDGYDFSITDGTNIRTNANHLTRNSSNNRLTFPTYLNNLTTSVYLDADSITFGTGSDWVVNGGAVANTLQWTPLADDSTYNIGTSGTSLNSNFNVFTGASLGFKLSSSGATHSLTYDGGIVNLNASSNFATNICSGTSTGATTIGNSAGGAVAVDTDSTINLNADDSYALTVSAGTIGIAATGGDITIDATDKSVIIRGTEEVGDAVVIHADGTAGGIDITSGTGDIVMASTDDISMTVNNTTTDNIIITNTPGTAENAIDIDATAGGIDIDFATAKNMAITGGQFIFTSNEAVASAFSVITNTGAAETITLVNTQGTAAGAITLTTTAAGSIDVNSGDNITIDVADDITIDTADGGISLIADGAGDGDITLDAEDDIILTTTGKLTITNTEAVTISGALTVTGDTQLISVTRIDTPIEIVAATNEIEITESGTVYVLTNATEFVTTLPTVASSAGVTFRFIAGAVPSGDDYTVVTDSSENKINGSVIVNGASVIADGPDDTITFTRDAAVIGDWCELTSDGVLWYLSGMAHAATGIVPSGS